MIVISCYFLVGGCCFCGVGGGSSRWGSSCGGSCGAVFVQILGRILLLGYMIMLRYMGMLEYMRMLGHLGMLGYMGMPS